MIEYDAHRRLLLHNIIFQVGSATIDEVVGMAKKDFADHIGPEEESRLRLVLNSMDGYRVSHEGQLYSLVKTGDSLSYVKFNNENDL